MSERKVPSSIAVALSGGGHRAAAFALGVLMYLVDASISGRTRSMASVSGGSFTNGAVAQAVDFTRVAPDEFRHRVVMPLARQLARRGTVFAPMFSQVYVGLLWLGAMLVFLPWAVPEAWAEQLQSQALVALPDPWSRPRWAVDDVRWTITIGAASATLLAWGLRGTVAAAALQRSLFRPAGVSTRLDQLSTTVDHVFCATDLRTAEHVYFSGRFVYSYRFGAGTPTGEKLGRVVQASAAYPGWLPPVFLDARPYAFDTEDDLLTALDEPRRKPRVLVLTDGGVYDNLAEQWARGLDERRKVSQRIHDEARCADAMLVVDAEGLEPWVRLPWVWVPALGDLLSVLRVADVLQANNAAQRRRAIENSFDVTDPGARPEGLPGILVQISQSPYRMAKFYHEPDKPAELRERARRVLEALGVDNEAAWAKVTRRNRSIRTGLRRLGRRQTAQLMHHGYVLAMCTLHLQFGGLDERAWPLLTVPRLEELEALC